MSSIFDEAVVYPSALSGAAIAAQYAVAQLGGATSDPQDLGQEELYGTDQPHDSTTTPIMANGLCRIRSVVGVAAFVLDTYIPGVGYMEQGRVTVWGDDTSGPAAGIFQFTATLATELARYTPEQGVLQVTMGATVAGQVYRADVYIRLGRGWTGPRIEVYPARRAGVALGAHLRYSPLYTDTVVGVQPGVIGVAPFFGPSDGAWNTQTAGALAAENWIMLANQQRACTMAWLRQGIVMRAYTDSVAYGAARNSLAIAADQATAAVAGYVTVRYGYSAGRAPMFEAEVYKTASGTVSQVADAGASNGLALNDTQIAAAAATADILAPQLVLVPPGRYAVWARVRVTNAGDTGAVRMQWFPSGAIVSATFTSTTYVWVYLGEAIKATAADFADIVVWRSGGVGATGVRIDRIMFAPTERRQAVDPAYDGGRDLGQEFLYDSRAVPELVAR